MNKLIEELAARSCWLPWKGKPKFKDGKPVIEPKTGKQKITKIPYSADKNKHYGAAKWHKPETRVPYEQAKKIAKFLQSHIKGPVGMGVVLDKEFGLVCIDVDDCRYPDTGKIEEWAQEILELVKEAGGTYIELSPSGTGFHIWGRGRLPNDRGIKRTMNNGHDIEFYSDNHYITVTKNALNDIPLNDIQPAIDTILSMLKNSPADRKSGGPAATPYCEGPKLSDEEVIEKIRNSRSGPKFQALYALGDVSAYQDGQCTGISEADQALLSILAFWTKDAEQIERIFRSSKLAETLDRKKDHEEDYLNRSITRALETVKGGFNPKAYAAKKRAEELRPEFEKAMREQEKAVPFDRQVSDFKKNDSENADRLAKMYKGKFLYCVDLKTWLKHDGQKWCSASPVELQEPARLAVWQRILDISEAYAAFVKECAQKKSKIPGDIQKAYTSILNYLNGPAQNNMAIQNSIKLAAGKPSMKCKAADFDNDPYLLNCANGVLNLKTFELMPHSPKQRFMKCTRAAYSPEEHSSLWRDTVRQIVPDNETYDYLQRMAGYCLTGSAADEKLFFLYGPGGTGKGTFIETLGHALGDYSTSVPVEILLSSKGNKEGNNPTPYKAMLKGVRLALSSESGIGNYFDEATLKYLTGRDAITGRFLHSNPITFTPSHKLVISSNYMPAIRDVTDEGVKRRLVIIPFDADIKDRDTTLKDRLFTPENLSDCLLWAVEGCRKWQSEGLQEGTYSQGMRKSINSYYLENDTLGEFIDTKCLLRENCYVSGQDLYRAYRNFIIAAGEDAEMSQSMLTRQLKRRLGATIKSVRSSGERGFEGITLANFNDTK